jgi:septal ring factor EnvC (AmiA/AmiB activator)
LLFVTEPLSQRVDIVPRRLLPFVSISTLLFLAMAAVPGIADTAGVASHPSSTLATADTELGPSDRFRQQSEDIRREIRIRQKKLDTTTRRETDIISELDSVEQQIQRVRRKSAGLDAQIAQIDRQLASAAAASTDLEQRIKANESYLARRLVAWYKLNRIGQIHLLASASDIVAFMQRKEALQRILAHDDNVRQNLLNHQSELKRLRDQLAADRRGKQKRIAEKCRQLDLLSQKMETRERLLSEVRRRKDLQFAALARLRLAADQLDKKFSALSDRSASTGQPGRAVPRPFSDFKGLLKMPVEGNIINLFGAYRNTQFNVTNFRSGIDIKTDKGEPVRAVYTGKIMYASWFKGYGNMMIIDHGTHYYTVYAHVEEMFKSTGDWVENGEVIATVGDTGSMSGARLYFEIRHHGKPVDPVKWLK